MTPGSSAEGVGLAKGKAPQAFLGTGIFFSLSPRPGGREAASLMCYRAIPRNGLPPQPRGRVDSAVIPFSRPNSKEGPQLSRY